MTIGNISRVSGATEDPCDLHSRRQAELEMANRAIYTDLGRVFAKEWDLHGRQNAVGLPLQAKNLGLREFARPG